MQRSLEDYDIAQGHEPALPTSINEKDLSEKHNVDEKSADISSIGAGETEDYPDKPTEEDLHTLHRVSGPIPWAAYTIAFVELCERLGVSSSPSNTYSSK